MGTGIATSISGVLGVVLLMSYARRGQNYLVVTAPLLRPDLGQWHRILRIGLPVGSDFVLAFASAAVTLFAISGFGASAQAGFSIGSRILQAVLVPGMSIAYAAGPIAGQNFGARNSQRVKQTFVNAAAFATSIVRLGTILIQWWPQLLLSAFDADPEATAIAKSFLLLMSWALVAQVLVYTCKTMFTGLGHTMPALVSSGMQFTLFSVPVLWLSAQPDFHIEYVWYLSIGSITLQALVSLSLLQRQFHRSLVSSPR
jgi:Na+-driven multidrug efflux pump